MKLNNRIIKALYEAKINSSINESYATVKDRFIRDGADKDEVKELLDLHKKLKDMRRLKAEEINIDSFVKGKSFEEFKSSMDKYSEKDTETKSDKFAELKKKIVAQDSKWTVYKIDTSEEAYLFHGLTKWCIVSGTKEDAKRYFLHYKDLKKSQFYFIVRNNQQGDEWDYIALQHQVGKDTYWDKEDKDHKDSEIRNLNLPDFKKEDWKFTPPDNWKLNSDGSYDVDGDISQFILKYIVRDGKFIFKFGKVSGDVDLGGTGLTTLEGCPKEVGGDFYCHNNKLTSLEGCPKEVGGYFYCSHNKLTSLEGGPEEVGGDFDCSHNKLTSLEGCPKEVGRDFYCRNNKAKFTKGNVKEVCEVKGEIYC